MQFHVQLQSRVHKRKEKMSDKPKPCCVCLSEKDQRDQCILFNGQDSGKCQEFVEKYKKCMQGYGFQI
ncbi:hypothetical protein ZYGR_0AG04390 [Zygosaccharomyces rouxii]|uniref:Cytochrome c oxidase copper chaperone n=1 Tax=Zygosaccharomyces rouxii TaxID=4956 RepID=A0A1Q3A9Y4_ZYGRO|nr:hypothetical protein ZYGR_0AG04390 [Zygosaccharomyces rouxii]